MTEAEFKALKIGDKIESGKSPFIMPGIVKRIEIGIITLEVDGGDCRFYSEYIQHTCRVVQEFTPKHKPVEPTTQTITLQQPIEYVLVEPFILDGLTKVSNNAPEAVPEEPKPDAATPAPDYNSLTHRITTGQE